LLRPRKRGWRGHERCNAVAVVVVRGVVDASSSGEYEQGVIDDVVFVVVIEAEG